MHATIRLLTILSLLWCALGIGEPAFAYDGIVASHQVAAGEAPDHAPDTPEPGEHHHCPIAPGLPLVRAAAAAAPTPVVHFAPRPAALASLTRAPPLQPPAA